MQYQYSVKTNNGPKAYQEHNDPWIQEVLSTESGPDNLDEAVLRFKEKMLRLRIGYTVTQRIGQR